MKNIVELYRMERVPVMQNVSFDTSDLAKRCNTGDILLVQDLCSGLIYNKAFIEELLTYDENYQNEQALSNVFLNHLHEVSSIIERRIGINNLVEIGCGKAFFLEMLSNNGFEIRGFDPAYEGSNPRVTKAFFDKSHGLKANGIILRHVLEHVKDPISFLSNVRDANQNSGNIYIEVPCLDWIIEKNAWFDIYYEHVNYFRLSDFPRIFSEVTEAGHLFGGQYIYVVAPIKSFRVPQNASLISSFSEGLLKNIYGLANLAKRCMSENNQVLIWGAASKGVIFSIMMERLGVKFEYAIDANPKKQGKYMPVSGTQIVSPEFAMQQFQDQATVFVMNSNYVAEIKRMSQNKFRYVGVENE